MDHRPSSSTPCQSLVFANCSRINQAFGRQLSSDPSIDLAGQAAIFVQVDSSISEKAEGVSARVPGSSALLGHRPNRHSASFR